MAGNRNSNNTTRSRAFRRGGGAEDGIVAVHCLDTRGFGTLGAPAECDGALVWAFRRNCSIAPSQLLMFFVSLSVVSLLVAVLCWSIGAVLVTPFTVLELLVFAGALLHYARHAGDRERVSVGDGRLVVEWECAGQIERAEFDPRQVRVVVGDRGLIEISGSGQQAWVGRYTRPERLEPMARELRRALLAA